MTDREQRTGTTDSVTAVPPADQATAVRHFGTRLAFETDPSDVWADLRTGAESFVLIDVRSRGAFHAGHLPGAVSLPLALLDEQTIASLPAGRVAVTYCWGPGCNGSTRGAHRLAKLGVPVKEMIGGYEYWVREGLPVERRDQTSTGPVDPLAGLSPSPDVS